MPRTSIGNQAADALHELGSSLDPVVAPAYSGRRIVGVVIGATHVRLIDPQYHLAWLPLPRRQGIAQATKALFDAVKERAVA